MTGAIAVRIPDLGLQGAPLRASIWHASPGEWLNQGDRLIELTAAGVLVDLPAPASGRLVCQLIAEDEPVVVGQTVAMLDPADSG
jgi:pyruvate/2-oxoglutarate dehydrogenase complex dihydrolipoamide acyltransferase (E2) component